MPRPIALEQLCNIRHKGIIRIRIGQKRTNTQKHLTNSKSRTPLILENIQTDSSVRVDVAVVDAGGEVYLWGFEWVVCWEVDVEEEDSAGVGGVVGAHDCCLPVEHVVSDGSGGAIGGWVFSEVDEFCVIFSCHVIVVVMCGVSNCTNE